MRIKELRQERNMTQADLAKVIGVATNTHSDDTISHLPRASFFRRIRSTRLRLLLPLAYVLPAFYPSIWVGLRGVNKPVTADFLRGFKAAVPCHLPNAYRRPSYLSCVFR